MQMIFILIPQLGPDCSIMDECEAMSKRIVMSGRVATNSAHTETFFCAGSTIMEKPPEHDKLSLHPAMASVHLLHQSSLLLRGPGFIAIKGFRVEKFAVRNCASGNVRKGLVVGSAVGTAVFVGAAAVAAVAAAGAMATSGGGREAAVVATRRGMQLFTQGDVKGSMVEFDKTLELDPRQRPYLWQRGLSLYYLNMFEEGATQFRNDVAVNPNDTEESIWCFLCEAQLHGPVEARQRFLKVGRDSRPVMRAAYELFRNGGATKELLSLGKANSHDYFYAHLYAGLYHESQNDTEAAKDAITAAVSSPYGARSGDYMATLAKVHCACRGWPVEEPLIAIV